MKREWVSGIRLATPMEYEDWSISYHWSAPTKYFTTDKWDKNELMFAACCGADWYGDLSPRTINKLKVEDIIKQHGPEYGIGVYRGKLKVKSDDKNSVTHVKTKNGWITCWAELPRTDENFDEAEEW